MCVEGALSFVELGLGIGNGDGDAVVVVRVISLNREHEQWSGR